MPGGFSLKYYLIVWRTLARKLLLFLVVISVLALGYAYYLDSLGAPAVQKYEPIWQGDSSLKSVSLICNVVWGEEFIPEMLQILRSKDVKITFFLGGQWAEDFPELTALIDKEGHEIGNHGYAHLHPSRLSDEQNWEEIRRTEEIIQGIIGKKTRLFHPPYRELDERAVNIAGQKGYLTIMSSVDTIDWQRPAPEVIVSRVDQKAHNGAIVLMHPTAPTVRALPQIIENLKAQGYQIVTVSQLLNKRTKPKN